MTDHCAELIQHIIYIIYVYWQKTEANAVERFEQATVA